MDREVTALDLELCDREPIHVPGSIQPHGVLLVTDRNTGVVLQAAGPCERFLGVAVEHCPGRSLQELVTVGEAELAAVIAASSRAAVHLGEIETAAGERLDMQVAVSEGRLLVELEPAAQQKVTASQALAMVERAVEAFARAGNLADLYANATTELRRILGFDRVMLYRFLPDGTGVVVSEDRAEGLGGFVNHHFPASDIPRQARELYLRNVIRVIPDTAYTPAPLIPGLDPQTGRAVDLSDCVLRSVSPIHLMYLANMNVAASMSVSLIDNGRLWGLIACHHGTPRQVPYHLRAICRTLGQLLSQAIVHRSAVEHFAQRSRQRQIEDELLGDISATGVWNLAPLHRQGALMKVLDANGLAICRDGEIVTSGLTPATKDIMALRDWVLAMRTSVFVTDALSREQPWASALAPVASGFAAAVIAREEGEVILWFRPEQVEVVEWAGNPHKATQAQADTGLLHPRKSFEVWRETVKGRSLPWSDAEREALARLRGELWGLRVAARLRTLNEELQELLKEQDFLRKEVDHRVSNSLQMVSSVLALQSRRQSGETRDQLRAAEQRVRAVQHVHRLLYRTNQLGVVAFHTYLEELLRDLTAGLDQGWHNQIEHHVLPLTMPAALATKVGLVVSELVTNAVKYAYGDLFGPITVRTQTSADQGIDIFVEDRGTGGLPEIGGGFGSQMIGALLKTDGGSIRYEDAAPGTRAVVSLPLSALQS